MRVGTGRVTKMVMEFLNYKGAANFISNEVDFKFIQQIAIKNNIGVASLDNKSFIKTTLESTGGRLISAWGIAQTGDVN